MEPEELKSLARKVPAALLLIATSKADRILRWVETIRLRLLSGADMLKTDAAVYQLPQALLGPPDPTKESCDEVARIASLHNVAGHVFSHCVARAQLAGLLLGDDAEALWRAWDRHRAEAGRHADEAMRRLRSATAGVTAVVQVVNVVYWAPLESPPNMAWVAEAERLVRDASGEAAAAAAAVWRMRHAVVLEFFDAWALLVSYDAACAH